MPRSIEISTKTILSIFALVGLFWFLIQIKEVIFLLFLSLILTATLHSPVESLARKGIPRPLSILIIYLFLLGGFLGLVSTLVPPLVEETTKLVNNLPAILDSLNRVFIGQFPTQDFLRSLSSETRMFGGNIFRFTLDFFGGLVTLFTLLVFTFYLLLRWRNLPDFLTTTFGEEQRERIIRILKHIEIGLGGWLRGEAVLCLTIGLLSFVGLTLLQIPYVLPLAIFAGLMEIVPLIGPIISAIPAILLALTVSPLLALATAALYFLIQQLENNLIVPKVMQRAVGVDPLITILALLVGGKLMGVLGALLAVPFVVLLKIIFLEIFRTTPVKNA